VLRTDPRAGTELAQGETVTVFISTGEVEVPDVVGRSRGDAVSALQGAGLRVAEDERAVTDEDEDGTVLSQDPRADADVPTGSTVTITVGRLVAPPPTSASTTTSTTTATSTSTSTTSTLPVGPGGTDDG
jgi:serine/threonine-protein kinase